MRGGYFIYPYGSYADFASFPAVGIKGTIYIDEALSELYVWDGAAYVSAGGGGGGAWGTITGTITDQTDLVAQLALKDTILDPAVDPDLYFNFQTDFAQNDRATLNVAASGAGSAATNDATTGCNTTENCFGVYEMTTGTTTTGRVSIYNSGTWALGSHKIDYGVRFSLTTLSDGTDTYTVYAGLCDNPGSGNVTDGVFFRYTHSENGGRWQAMVADAGSRVSADTGVAPTATVNQVFRIVVNQAGTEALFYIDGVLRNTVTSGLPGAGDFTLFNNKIEKSAGTNTRAMSIDWLYLKTTRSTAR